MWAYRWRRGAATWPTINLAPFGVLLMLYCYSSFLGCVHSFVGCCVCDDRKSVLILNRFEVPWHTFVTIKRLHNSTLVRPEANEFSRQIDLLCSIDMYIASWRNFSELNRQLIRVLDSSIRWRCNNVSDHDAVDAQRAVRMNKIFILKRPVLSYLSLVTPEKNFNQ